MRATSARRARGTGIAGLIAVIAACGDGDRRMAREATTPAVVNAGAVDSALPIAEHLRRFRMTAGPNPDSLRRAAPSVDALVRRWALALEARDTATLVALTLDRAEFAWLFYPETPMSRAPYEVPPALLWSQIIASSDEGLRRTLDALGGHRVLVDAVRCPAPPAVEGPNRVRQGCRVALRVDGGAAQEDRYFGSVVERNGRFKLVSHTNRL